MTPTGVNDAAQAYCAALAALASQLSAAWAPTDWQEGALQWRFYRPVDALLATQGWKIHVSAAAVQAATCLRRITPALAQLQIPFKLPRRLGDLTFINSGDGGAELLGKFITLYPANDQLAQAALARLEPLWPGSDGPQVVTDLQVRAGSALSFRFAVFHAQAAGELVSSTGTHAYALLTHGGIPRADSRVPGGRQVDGAPAPPVPGVPPRDHGITLHQPLTIGTCDYLPLALLHETPRASTFLVVELATLRTAILKAGNRGVAGNAHGQDVRDLLRSEAQTLQALERYPGLAPRLLQWHDAPWPLLVSQDLAGCAVSELPRQARLACLPLLAAAVARLHAAGIVHGDIKLENAIRHAGGVSLIDFELAARCGAPMRPSGTAGLLAPEIATTLAPAAPARDVYALAGCVVQAVLEAPPALVAAGAGRLLALLANEGAQPVVALIAPWLAAQPHRRPSARQASVQLQASQPGWGTLAPAAGQASSAAQLRWCRRASSDAALLTRTYLRNAERGACWRNEHFMRGFDCEAINLGAAGILLGLRSVDCALGRDDHREAIDAGARWLAARGGEGKSAGLFTGNAGVAVALAVAGRHLQNDAYLAAARARFQVAAADRREVDLFSGVAGVLWGGCVLHGLLQQAWPLDAARDLAQHLAGLAARELGVPVWRAGTPQRSYFGCAHGSAGVAMALATWGRSSGDTHAIASAREAFRCLRQQGRNDAGDALRIGPHESRHHAVGNWCHGVGGYLWAILNALGDDPLLRDEIDWAVTALAQAKAAGTPTYCHGLAGQLELWHLVARIPRFAAMAHARAGKLANALRALHVKVDGRCTWPADAADIITPDLWVGFLGPASALAMHAAGVGQPLLSLAWLDACARPAAVMNRPWQPAGSPPVPREVPADACD